MSDPAREKPTAAATPRSIRWHLVQVLLIAILPIGLFAAGMLFLHWQAQEHQREHTQLETTHLLAAAVDNALDSTIQRLAIFARLWASGPATDAQVYQQAKSALAASPDWENILAFGADGRGTFRMDRAFGAALPEVELPAYVATALRENRPVVSDLFVSPSRKRKVVGVAIPVPRDGAVTHALVASLNLEWFDQLLRRQGLPTGGIGGIFDSQMKFVARSKEGDERRGADPAPLLAERIEVQKEGIGKFPALDGTSVYTSWTPTAHGWMVAFATPAQPIDGAFWSHLAILIALWATVVLLGIAYAVNKGKRITRSLLTVERQATYLGRGRKPPSLPADPVAEIHQALRGLEQAGAVLETAMKERDRSLTHEREARAAAEAANQAKDEFLAMLGHELRNPLAAISNSVSILRAGQRTPEQVDFATGVIGRQSQHLKRLIDDLLDVGRVMTGKIILDRQSLDLAASVRHVAQTLETAGRLAERRVEVDVQAAWINGDHTRVEQIVTNLLVNAATYTRPGGRIRLSLERSEGFVDLSIADDGAGISPEHLPKVFDLFFQAEATSDRANSGLGIGLTLVKRLVELHGGTVRAESPGKGQGATFVVRFPAAAAPTVSEHYLRSVDTGMSREVLIVEDNRDERESLRVALELEKHRVLHAPSAAAALEILRREHPPIAFIDIGLPGTDGYGLARSIRAEFGDGIILAALTGYGSPADAQRAREAGFDAHLTKPVDVADLARIVRRAAPARTRKLA